MRFIGVVQILSLNFDFVIFEIQDNLVCGFVGVDRNTFERIEQGFAINCKNILIIGGDYAIVIGEGGIYKPTGNFGISGLDKYVRIAKVDYNATITIQG